MYGTLLRMGGPNSDRASESRFSPPMITVAASGTATVVLTDTVVMVGVWRNCVNTMGLLGTLKSTVGKIGTTTGNRLIGPGARFVSVGVRDMRTKRRSAEMTA